MKGEIPAFKPTPVDQMIEERFPTPLQLAKLVEMLGPMQPPPPPPSRWQRLKMAWKGTS